MSEFEQRIRAEPGSTVYAVLNGDIHVRNGHPVYRFESFALEPRPVDPTQARLQPSRVLATESRIVPFAGRGDELARLTSWRDDPEPGLSVLLVHGPGGQGKTRLAAQFALASAANHWTVWAGHHSSDPTATTVVAPGKTGSALVVVVEYAERWPVDDLQLFLQNPILRVPQRARVLLVSRSAGSWWPGIRHRLTKAEIAVGESVDLAPLAASPEQRRDAFMAAGDAFARVFGVRANLIQLPERLDGDEFKAVLSVHMAALVAVDALAHGRRVPADLVGLSAYLLNREYDYWQSRYDHDAQFTTAPAVLARTVHTATLTQRQPRALAGRILAGTGVAAEPEVLAVVDDHAGCYPPAAAGFGLEPLYPDRLGEDFLALRIPGHGHGDYAPDPWARTAPERLLALAKESDFAALTRPVLGVLIEAAHRWPHVRDSLQPILLADPRLAVDAGGFALARLAEIDGIDSELLDAILPLLPIDRHVDLDVGAARVVQVVTRAKLTHTEDDETRAGLLAALGVRQQAVGLYREAHQCVAEAVAIYRGLAETAPQHFRRPLIRALHLDAIALSDLGRTEEALALAEELIALERRYGDPTSEADLLSMANSLHHLSIYLSDLGQLHASLAPAEEAVRILRDLNARVAVTAHLAALAFSLDGLGTRLYELARPRDALPLMREGVDIYRSLAETDPNLYLPSLSVAVHNLGNVLSELGRRDESLFCARESVRIDRQLVAANPGAFLPDLASSLINLAIDLGALGQEESALPFAEESLEIRRRLCVTDPGTYRPAVARTLLNLSVNVSNTGDRKRALDLTAEALGIFRPLAEANPAMYEEWLAGALSTLGLQSARIGRRYEAVAAAEEAVQRFRRCEDAFPDSLPNSLYGLGVRYAEVGRRDEAVAVTEEAVATYRALDDLQQADHRQGLARALNSLGERMAELDRDAEALTAITEAIAIFRSLEHDDPSLDREELSHALANRALQESRRGAHQDAAVTAREAVSVCEPLAREHPAYYLPELAARLSRLATVLTVGGLDPREAHAAAQQAHEIYLPLAEQYPQAFADGQRQTNALLESAN
ncbi:tetratricopeptide repeat protein [Actinoplanes italicus]|uniref:tetratricopeptide repeat protein n=1 Tax=Actinoplanes italicus TaxID=113567 RepID=UPI0014747B6C|nr:tetratricopeptide repeat protein [Actinoplanes italicus]